VDGGEVRNLGGSEEKKRGRWRRKRRRRCKMSEMKTRRGEWSH